MFSEGVRPGPARDRGRAQLDRKTEVDRRLLRARCAPHPEAAAVFGPPDNISRSSNPRVPSYRATSCRKAPLCCRKPTLTACRHDVDDQISRRHTTGVHRPGDRSTWKMSLDRHSDDADEPPRAHPGIRIAGDGGTRGQRHPEWVSTDTPLDNPIPIRNQLGSAHLWGEAASERQLGRPWYSWPLTYSSTETGNRFLEPFGVESRCG